MRVAALVNVDLISSLAEPPSVAMALRHHGHLLTSSLERRCLFTNARTREVLPKLTHTHTLTQWLCSVAETKE